MVKRADIVVEIERLRGEINHHNYAYHSLDAQEVSDFEFDALFRTL